MLASVCCVSSVFCSDPNTVEEAAIQLSILHPLQQGRQQLATDQEGTQEECLLNLGGNGSRGRSLQVGGC